MSPPRSPGQSRNYQQREALANDGAATLDTGKTPCWAGPTPIFWHSGVAKVTRGSLQPNEVRRMPAAGRRVQISCVVCRKLYVPFVPLREWRWLQRIEGTSLMSLIVLSIPTAPTINLDDSVAFALLSLDFLG